MPDNAATGVAVSASGRHGVSFREAFWVWARVAMLSFGGPAGQIAVMHRIFVEEKRWIGESRFLHALNYCMLLPGPEAHQLVIYIGWLLHRVRGGIVAGTLFVLPGVISLWVLSWVYVTFGSVGIVQGLFFGLKAAVVAIVLEAVVRVGQRALKSRAMIAVAASAFVAIFFFTVPFPFIIFAAALIGFAGNAARLEWFRAFGAHGLAPKQSEGPAAIDAAFAERIPQHIRSSGCRLGKIAVIGVTVWLGPLVVLFAMAGPSHVFTAITLFNAKMAVVTFGGAYAVLAYMAQQAVQYYHWLKPGEMLVGLGFAETTPGPLISVVEFVGFMAAFRHPGSLTPVLAGTFGGLLAAWTTFVPSFLWIFLGGPYIEALRDNKSLSAALNGITAAVVGVILNLAVWFALHTLFGRVDERHAYVLVLQVPAPASINIPSLVLSVAAAIAILRFKISMISILLACSLAGGAVHFLGGM